MGDLFKSRKAVMLLLALLSLTVLAAIGVITGPDYLDTLKVLLPSWFVAHAGEQGARALAGRSRG